ncbi:unnamed protein product [Prorocentrum cordatum]|uniref:Reverse transcriptase domain-containing protein n=1 Tax=Prorocentrum cordatum TaxID=2364126 RepID=A0ABN9UGE1_9DINO|nr:unnamed protein product [Polarella glacialis]
MAGSLKKPARLPPRVRRKVPLTQQEFHEMRSNAAKKRHAKRREEARRKREEEGDTRDHKGHNIRDVVTENAKNHTGWTRRLLTCGKCHGAWWGDATANVAGPCHAWNDLANDKPRWMQPTRLRWWASLDAVDRALVRRSWAEHAEQQPTTAAWRKIDEAAEALTARADAGSFTAAEKERNKVKCRAMVKAVWGPGQDVADRRGPEYSTWLAARCGLHKVDRPETTGTRPIGEEAEGQQETAGQLGRSEELETLGVLLGTINVASWSKHGLAAFQAAGAHGADVLFVQEHKLTRQGMRTAQRLAARRSWHLVEGTVLDETQGKNGRDWHNYGGLACATRGTWRAERLWQMREIGGEVAVFRVRSGRQMLHVGVVHLRRNSPVQARRGLLLGLRECLAGLGGAAVLGGDWNVGASEGILGVLTGDGQWQPAVPQSSTMAGSSDARNDYFLVQGVVVGEAVAHRDRIADHRLVTMGLKVWAEEETEGWAWRRAARYGVSTRPRANMDDEDDGWLASARPPRSQGPDLWRKWSRGAEAFLRGEHKVLTEGTGYKGDRHLVHWQRPESQEAGSVQARRERQLRELIAVSEAVQERRGPRVRDGATQALSRKRAYLRRKLGLPRAVGPDDAQDLHRKLREAVEVSRDERIKVWRESIREDNMRKRTYKWIRNPAQSCGAAVYDATEQRQYSGQAAVEKLRSFYHGHFSSAGSGNQPEDDLRWGAPSAGSVRRLLRTMAGTAAGQDQWLASELLLLPDLAYDDLVDLCLGFEAGGWPPSLKRWRQTHIPKESDSIPKVDRMRPIAIASTVVRMWHKHRAEQIAEFLEPAFEADQAGGLRQRTLEGLLEGTLTEVEQTMVANRIAGTPAYDLLSEDDKQRVDSKKGALYGSSWDFESAFDRTDPVIVGRIWKECGVPHGIVDGIVDIWCNQERWIESAGLVASEPIAVSRSLPQGDPASMLGMATVLMPPTRRMKRRVATATCCVYADDRTACTRSLEDMQEVERHWGELEQLTALRTHPGKTQRFVVSADVLGVDFSFDERELTPREMGKLKAGIERLQRIAKLPLGWRARRRAVATAAMPLMAWGLVTALPQEAQLMEVRREVRRAVCGRRWPSASVELLHLLAVGHYGDLRCGPTRCLQRHLEAMGFHRDTHTGDWKHGDRHLRIDDRRGRAAHVLREAWRQERWDAFKAQGATRRDSRLAVEEGVAFDERAFHVATEVLQSGALGSHALAVLTGAMWSDARLDVAMGREPRPCSDCPSGEVPDVVHHWWRCDRWAGRRRGIATPRSALARRMGWPEEALQGADARRAWRKQLEYMAGVRQSLVEDRYRGGRPSLGGTWQMMRMEENA